MYVCRISIPYTLKEYSLTVITILKFMCDLYDSLYCTKSPIHLLVLDTNKTYQIAWKLPKFLYILRVRVGNYVWDFCITRNIAYCRTSMILYLLGTCYFVWVNFRFNHVICRYVMSLTIFVLFNLWVLDQCIYSLYTFKNILFVYIIWSCMELRF